MRDEGGKEEEGNRRKEFEGGEMSIWWRWEKGRMGEEGEEGCGWNSGRRVDVQQHPLVLLSDDPVKPTLPPAPLAEGAAEPAAESIRRALMSL